MNRVRVSAGVAIGVAAFSLMGPSMAAGPGKDEPVKIELTKPKAKAVKIAEKDFDIEGEIQLKEGALPPDMISFKISDKNNLQHGSRSLILGQDDKDGRYTKKDEKEYRFVTKLAGPKTAGKYEVSAEGICVPRDVDGNLQPSKLIRYRSPKGTTIEVK